MKGSVLIVTLFLMMAMALLTLTTFSIAQSHFEISRNVDLHQEAYYLADAGMKHAVSELRLLVEEAFRETISEFTWNPLLSTLTSLQSSAQAHVTNRLDSKINKLITDRRLLSNFPGPNLPNAPEDSKIKILIKFTNTNQNPSRLLISVRGEIGKIRRRIDGEIAINKVSGLYTSALLDHVLYTGHDVRVANGGRLGIQGPAFSEGRLQIKDNSNFISSHPVAIRNELTLQNNSAALFTEEIICSSMNVTGNPGSQAVFLSDVYTYGEIFASGSDNQIEIEGRLVACPEIPDASVGVVAGEGAAIQLKGDIFINGTLHYPPTMNFLFGQDTIPIEGDHFKSCESIGGRNGVFYFPDFLPEYGRTWFNRSFPDLSTGDQAALVYHYISTPPSNVNDLEGYNKHLEYLDSGHIEMIPSVEGMPVSGYTKGLIFANGMAMRPLYRNQQEAFFSETANKMKRQTGWHYRSHLNPAIQVPLRNVIPNGDSFSIIDETKPIVYIVSDSKDITLPSGEYEGILITDGTILVPSGAQVEFSGMLIAGNDLLVEGRLELKEDKETLFVILGSQDDKVRRYLRVESEKDLFEIKSSKEVSMNLIW